MGLYQWRLRISLAAAQQSLHFFEEERPRDLVLARRLRQAFRRLLTRIAFLACVQRSRPLSLLGLAFGVLIGATPLGLAETLDVPGQFAILGVGSVPCTSVIRAVGHTPQVRETDRRAMLAWAQGYLSFYNSVSEGTYDVTGGLDAAALQESLFEFCRQHPQASLMNAVDDLLLAALSTRF